MLFLFPFSDHLIEFIKHDRDVAVNGSALETFAVLKALLGTFVDDVLRASVISALETPENRILAGMPALSASAPCDFGLFFFCHVHMKFLIQMSAFLQKLIFPKYFRHTLHSSLFGRSYTL